jgi:two-component system sensor histidine kinase/response regulator
MLIDTPREAPDRILIIDDDKIIVEILTQSLTLAGYAVTSALDGEEGLALARQLKPDLVLLDVMMPKMDGYAVCRQIKRDQETQLIPVIILTALTDRDDKLKALEVGADEFIRKPPDRQELLIRIRSLLKTKKLHQQVEASYLELRALEEAKNNLTSMIVHDMRGPLTSIMGGLKILLDRQNQLDPDARETLITASLLSTRRLMTMVEAMLDLQRLESGQLPVRPQPVVLGRLIDESVQAVRPLLQADGVQIDVKADQPVSPVLLDNQLLTRVVNNLLFNAIKFSPEGGRIGIWTQHNGKWLLVNIADQGPGVPKEHREQIFDKYARLQTGKRDTGIGLGLAFCKLAVEAMKGRIWVEDVPRAGALFRVALPMVRAPHEEG